MSLQGNFAEVAAQLTMEEAETHAIVGQCAEARGEMAPGLASSRDNFTLGRASRVFALCGAGAESASLSSEIAKRFPDATLTIRIHLPLAAAALALRRGDPVRALEILDPVKPYDRAPASEFWPGYLPWPGVSRLKDGLLAARNPGYVDHRGLFPTSSLYPMAQLASLAPPR